MNFEHAVEEARASGSVIDVRGELDGAVIFARGAFSYEVVVIVIF